MKKIYYVRHGESDANLKQYIAGSETDVDLTENGRDQARKAGFELKDKHIDLIVSSPMKRTRETAEIIADVLGYDRSKILENKLFIELYAGPYAGQSYDLRKEHIEKGVLMSGMETAEEVHKRMRKALEWLREQPFNNIVVVSHGGTGKMVRAIVEELPYHEFMKIERMENSAIYEFEL
jgi:broad specificity phosphatase PhoE